jgi:hypothetical protein
MLITRFESFDRKTGRSGGKLQENSGKACKKFAKMEENYDKDDSNFVNFSGTAKLRMG